MKRIVYILAGLSILTLLVTVVALDAAEPAYVKKSTRLDTVLASLKASGLPTLEGPWYYAGPFDHTDGKGFEAAYGPEKDKAFDPKNTYSQAADAGKHFDPTPSRDRRQGDDAGGANSRTSNSAPSST